MTCHHEVDIFVFCVFTETEISVNGLKASIVLPCGPVWLGVDMSVQDGDVQTQGRR